MKIAIGSDHAGLTLKRALLASVLKGLDIVDLGTDSRHAVDYPDIGHRLAKSVASGQYERGILICGTGIGMAMTANKTCGIRAANCSDTYSAEMSVRHNDANVLCLGSRTLGPALAERIVKVWLNTQFDGGRHAERVNKIELCS
ncbi:ribose 5-phosphate isomerase B [Candidatus Acetothermia bacterium]|nr:ribose 5-phosphate isomerase B [Candidatus Acetothermia bacterium]MCI2427000.1 ribose 5-phosphate isomerase B [Candidatus Acetothermia bacterium]MCI2428442.1 ribose 5-phosphate isomerase B [Candidatus Acetothermia bacterium]